MVGLGDPPGGLVAAAARLEVALDVRQTEQLELFVDLLGRWNSRFNLLSRQDMDRIWTRHVLDSLSLLPLLPPLPAGSVLDVGSGAGFPGLPLAIASPERSFLLVDRHHRKIRFLELAVHTLGLVNARCVCSDVADLPGEERFDVIVSRAVGGPGDLWACSGHLLAPGGRLVLMTGAGGCALEQEKPAPAKLPAELQTPPAVPLQGAHIESRRSIEIPGLDRAHEVTIIQAGEPAQNQSQNKGRVGCRM